ncbi:unknown [Clostridium sp. CAG:729]|nr:unknown [Clostridium sp. CAG:729]
MDYKKGYIIFSVIATYVPFLKPFEKFAKKVFKD